MPTRKLTYKRILLGVVCLVPVFAPAILGQPSGSGGRCTELPTRPIERKFNGAQSHCYEADLTGGRFVRFLVEQGGADLALTLSDAAGKTLLEINFAVAPYGSESLLHIPADAGKYKLEIRNAEAAAANASYKLSAETGRNATDADRKRIEAQTAFVEAQKAAASSPQDSFRLFQKAESLFRELGDQTGEAQAIIESGLVLFTGMRDAAAALKAFERAAAWFERAGNDPDRARALKYVGVVHLAAGDDNSALENWLKAEPLFHAADGLEKADMTQGIGNIMVRKTDLTNAREAYNKVLSLLRANPSEAAERIEASTMANLGVIHLEMNLRQAALSAFTRAWEIAVRKGFSEEVIYLTNIGRAHDELGDKRKAIEYFMTALSKAALPGHKAAILLSMGKSNVELGEPRKALDQFNEALKLFQEGRDRFGESRTIIAIGGAHSKLGDREEALRQYNRALMSQKSLGNQFAEAQVLANLMAVGKSSAANRLAAFHGKLAINLYQRLRAGLHRLDLETQRSFMSLVAERFRMLAALLVMDGRVSEAQEVLGLLKEDELYNFTRRSPESVPAVPNQIVLNQDESAAAAEYNRLTDAIIAKRREFRKAEIEQAQATAEKLKAAIVEAETAFLRFSDELTEKFNRPAAGTPAGPTTSAWQKRLQTLGDGTVLVSTFVTGNQYFAIVTTPDSQVARVQTIDRTDLFGKILQMRRALNQPGSQVLPQAGDGEPTVVQDLYRMLVKPIEADLANAKVVLWSLDGNLRYVPFSVLHDGKGYLLEKYASAVATLAEPPENQRESPENWRALGAGVSTRIDDFDPTPRIKTLLSSVVRLEGPAGRSTETGLFPGERLLNKDFSRPNFVTALRQKPQLVFVGTHFSLANGKDTDSFLLLGDRTRLSLAEMRTDRSFDLTGVDLLTLAACNTAIAPEASGVELESLGVIAQRRGAKTVLASLWSIPEGGTAELMQNFYRQYKDGKGGVSKPEALRQAQLSLLRGRGGNFAHPAHWGGFIVLGNL